MPGDIYADLERAGVIGNPLYGFNDVLTRWVAYDNWTYYKSIQSTLLFNKYEFSFFKII